MVILRRMSTFIGVAGLFLAVALLWGGHRKFAWSSPLKALMSALDLLALVIAVAQLGWLGLVAFVAANIVAFIGWGSAGWIFVDAQCAAAAAAGMGRKDDYWALVKTLNASPELAPLGPRGRAVMIRALAERHRDVDESRSMAPAIGLLWTIADKPSVEWLVERMDSILRVFDKDAADSGEVADTIAASTQRSAATAREIIEAMAVAGGASPTGGDALVPGQRSR